jgi:hypothetical protein
MPGSLQIGLKAHAVIPPRKKMRNLGRYKRAAPLDRECELLRTVNLGKLSASQAGFYGKKSGYHR